MGFLLCRDNLNELTQGHKLRGRGFLPSLTDAEVITMEIVGEFLKIDQIKVSGNISDATGCIFFLTLVAGRHLHDRLPIFGTGR